MKTENYNSALLSSLTNEQLDALYLEKIGHKPISEEGETRENVLQILTDHAKEDTDQKAPFIFTCSECGQTKVHNNGCSTGYGSDPETNAKTCFDCCGLNDAKALKDLKPKEKFCLYWDGKEVINWPGTLRIKPLHVVKGRHNIARTRETVYFKFEGANFTGIQYGNNSQIIHIKKTAN